MGDGIADGGAAGIVGMGIQQQQQQQHEYAGGVPEIRERVLSLLQKYDQGKVNRIDIIMDKFKGKEHLLLQKMEQRYESNNFPGTSPGPSPTTSVQKRNELAM